MILVGRVAVMRDSTVLVMIMDDGLERILGITPVSYSTRSLANTWGNIRASLIMFW